MESWDFSNCFVRRSTLLPVREGTDEEGRKFLSLFISLRFHVHDKEWIISCSISLFLRQMSLILKALCTVRTQDFKYLIYFAHNRFAAAGTTHALCSTKTELKKSSTEKVCQKVKNGVRFEF